MEKTSRWELIKKILGTVIIVAGFVFILLNKEAVYNATKSGIKSDPFQQSITMKSNSKISQDFISKKGLLKKVGIFTSNQGFASATGYLNLTLYDENGKQVATDRKYAAEVLNNKYTWFRFSDETRPEMVEDAKYTAVFEFKDFKNPQGFGAYSTLVYNKNCTEPAYVNSVKTSNDASIRMSVSYLYYDYSLLIKLIGIMILAIVIIWLPYRRIQALIEKKWDKKIDIPVLISRIAFFTTPISAYFIMEILSHHKMSTIRHYIFTTKGVLNIALYAIVLVIAYAITNRTQYASIITWILTLVLGLGNYFVSMFRGIPVLVADVLSIGTAMNVAGGYRYTFEMYGVWSVTIFVCAVGVMLGMKPYKGLDLKKRLIPIALSVVMLVGGYYFYVGTDAVAKLGIEDSQWKPQLTYTKNGTILSFVTSWKYIKTEKPSGYSVDKVEKLTKKFKSDETSIDNAKKKKMPNVIAIMNESLADFSFDGKLETTEDYIPFIRSMKKNTVKGQLFVSIEGANTANSEFEFLTGDSMAFFAPRSVPYNNLLKGIVPSLTRTLKMQGYDGCNAYHPYMRSGWNRENVYKYLGFNAFYSEEYYKGVNYVRNFISDEADFDQIIKDYEASNKNSDNPFYEFNVTVQNHGGYVGQRGTVEEKVKVKTSGLSTEENNQYMTLAKLSDDAFKKLVKYFEKVDEPTIIVMFGDHQPPLVEEFYETLFGKKQAKFTTEDTANWYSTPYVIWTNYDIESNTNMNMSCNYLSSYLLNMMGADMTGYNKYLLDLQKKVPVLTALFYQGDDGKFYENNEKSKYSKYIDDYSKIQYNGLFDQKNRVDDFFFLKGGNYEVK